MGRSVSQVARVIVLGTALTVLAAINSDGHSQEIWTLQPALRIGALDGPAALTAFQEIAIHPEKALVYVSQPMEYTVKIFNSATGEFVSQFGRRGRGPGEFEDITRLGWDGHQLTVRDRLQSKILWFTDAGGHIRTRQLSPVMLDAFRSVSAARTTPDGHYWAEPMRISTVAVADGAITHTPIRILDDEGKLKSGIADLPLRDIMRSVDYGTGGTVFQVPFRTWPLWQYDPDGTSIAIAEVLATNDGFTLSRRGYNGRAIFSRRFTTTPIRVTGRAKDSIFDTYTKLFSRGTTPAMARQLAVRHVEIPSTYQPISALIHAREGDVWLRTEPASAQNIIWKVYDPTGRHTADVTIPGGVTVLYADRSNAWGVQLGEYDIPRLIRFRIVKR